MNEKKKRLTKADKIQQLANEPSIVSEVAGSAKPEGKQVEGPTIKLGGDDVALVLRATGRSETYLRANGKEREEVTEGELLMMALSFFLEKKDFVEMMKNEYLKIAKGRMINTDPDFKDEE